MTSERGVRVLPTLPGLRHGVASLIALPGTGRLQRLSRLLEAHHHHRPTDPYEYVAGLESSLESMRNGSAGSGSMPSGSAG
ncbi:MAG: hypothetical protein ACLGIA_13585 [Actinomycetes bacterium]